MKTCDEWKQAFNLYWNNIASGKAPGLVPYEISRFLTDGEYSVVTMLCNGTLPKTFESTEDVTSLLASLVKQGAGTLVTESVYHIVTGSSVFSLPSDFMYRTYESCVINVPGCGETEAVVVPVTQDEFWRTHRDPFKKDNRNRVLRLAYAANNAATGASLSETGYSELVSSCPIVSYNVRYISRPAPIVLENLTGGLTIDGVSTAQTCLLNEKLHPMILSEAVRLAKEAWNS